MKALLILILGLSLVGAPALADSDQHEAEHRGKTALSGQSNTLWQQECGSCHLAFPARMLPAASWRKMMSSLDKHFGADASLTVPENREITAFLVNNAASLWRAPSAPLRITETAWFQREHDELAAATWKRAAIKRPANCAACHPGADTGDFEEDRVRIPR
jgi:nitrate/TMAO reductase-like tetraheme cytochrome c subunit